MKYRIATLCALVLIATALAGCGSPAQVAQAPTVPAVPTRTPRPTFTATSAPPTATRLVPTSTVQPTNTAAPTAAPPTATLTAVPQKPALTASGLVNVRSGPGTNYTRLGQLEDGQQLEITGTNPDGDWWQIQFNGKDAWVAASMVTANDAAANVAVAQNIPAAPIAVVAAPQPQPQPQPLPQPTQAPPPPATLFAQAGVLIRDADNTNFTLVTFWGRMGNPAAGNPPGDAGNYKLRVSAPSGSKEAAFAPIWQRANPGQPSEFMYDVKIELPRAGGAYRAVIVDGSGKEVSDPVSGTLLDRSHDVILTWVKR